MISKDSGRFPHPTNRVYEAEGLNLGTQCIPLGRTVVNVCLYCL